MIVEFIWRLGAEEVEIEGVACKLEEEGPNETIHETLSTSRKLLKDREDEAGRKEM